MSTFTASHIDTTGTTIDIGEQTIISTESNKKIYAFSDIHADIHVLIIILRDLACVIRKKKDVVLIKIYKILIWKNY